MNINRIARFIFLTTSALTVIFFLVLYLFKTNCFSEIDKLPTLDHSIIFHIDSVKHYHNSINVKGWCIKKGENNKGYAIKAILWDCSSNKGLYFPVNQSKRIEVTEAQNDGYNYDFSGFSLSIKKNINKKCNDLYLQLKKEDYTIAVNTGLSF